MAASMRFTLGFPMVVASMSVISSNFMGPKRFASMATSFIISFAIGSIIMFACHSASPIYTSS